MKTTEAWLEWLGHLMAPGWLMVFGIVLTLVLSVYARLRPDGKLENLTKKDLEKLFSSIKKVLIQGIENRGTSVSDFIDTKGKKGNNQELLYVYKRAGKLCLICHKKLQKIKLASRTTVFCGNCQKKK